MPPTGVISAVGQVFIARGCLCNRALIFSVLQNISLHSRRSEVLDRCDVQSGLRQTADSVRVLPVSALLPDKTTDSCISDCLALYFRRFHVYNFEAVISALLETIEGSCWIETESWLCNRLSSLTQHHHNKVYLTTILPPSERGQHLVRRLSYFMLQQLVQPGASTKNPENLLVRMFSRCACACAIYRGLSCTHPQLHCRRPYPLQCLSCLSVSTLGSRHPRTFRTACQDIGRPPSPPNYTALPTHEPFRLHSAFNPHMYTCVLIRRCRALGAVEHSIFADKTTLFSNKSFSGEPLAHHCGKNSS